MKGYIPQTGVARRLDRACRHVSDLWFPADQKLLAKLRGVLDTDESPAALDASLELLEGDFSLFMYAMKELLSILAREGITLPDGAGPREIIERTGLAQLKQILNEADDRLSSHELSTADETQTARMREAIVSASTASVLAEAQLANRELGFFAGLLRQLGLTLIAFNYPSVYQRASEASKQGGSLEAAISETLGFSPSTLAVALTKDWNLPRGLIDLLDEESHEEQLDRELEVNALSHSLREICRVGEALARANEPERYPLAAQDWAFAQEEIKRRLGPTGLAMIREAIEDRFESLLVEMPSFFRGGTILDPEAFLARHRESEMGAHNPLVKECRLHVQERILELYHSLAEGQGTQTLLRRFAQVTIPSCGFTGGAVFTVDPSSQTLIPQLRIGGLVAHPFAQVDLSLCTHDDFVALTYKGDEPLAKSGVVVGEQRLTQLGAVFGYSQRVGVLYVELPDIVFEGSERQHQVHLRALAITLTDLLKLG